jgi:hypothetical protein
MLMKKLLLIGFLATVVFGAFGCGSDEGEEPVKPQPTDASVKDSNTAMAPEK